MTDYLVTVLRDRSCRQDEMDGVLGGVPGVPGGEIEDEEMRKKAKVAVFVAWKVQDEISSRRGANGGGGSAAGGVATTVAQNGFGGMVVTSEGTCAAAAV